MLDKEVKVGNNAMPITVLQLIEELYKTGAIARNNYLVKADRNERFVHGEQYSDINRLTGVIQDVPWQDFVPKVTVNLLRNLVLTWSSRLLRNRPSVSAYPHNAEIADAQSAQAALTIIEYLEYQYDIDEMMFDIVQRACAHGIGGVKLVYDPDDDNVSWDPVTIFDFVMDPTEKVKEARWVIFEKYIDESEANMLLKEKSISEKATLEQYYVGPNAYREGVKVRELWYRPGPRIPDGLYALEVSGYITEAMEYPYMFNTNEYDGDKRVDSFLPLSTFVVDPVRGTCWGDTWVNDAVPTQRQINEVESTLTKLRRDTAAAKLIAPGNIAEAIDTDNQILKIDDPLQAQMVRYMNPPQINNLLFADRDILQKRLYDLAGLNEMMVGAEAAKSGQSAKTIAYLSELDGMKQAGTSRSIERFLLDSWRKTLVLVRNYYTEPRILSIVGEDNVLSQASFVGSDIDGVDIRLEPREGSARYTATKRQNLIDQSQLGISDREEVSSMLETGIAKSTEDQRQGSAMAELIETVMKGADAYVDETIDPFYAHDYITEAIAIQERTGGDMRKIEILKQVREVYQQFKQEMSAQQAEQQAPQPQGIPMPGQEQFQ